jgi:hypothetical protein
VRQFSKMASGGRGWTLGWVGFSFCLGLFMAVGCSSGSISEDVDGGEDGWDGGGDGQDHHGEKSCAGVCTRLVDLGPMLGCPANAEFRSGCEEDCAEEYGHSGCAAEAQDVFHCFLAAPLECDPMPMPEPDSCKEVREAYWDCKLQ